MGHRAGALRLGVTAARLSAAAPRTELRLTDLRYQGRLRRVDGILVSAPPRRARRIAALQVTARLPRGLARGARRRPRGAGHPDARLARLRLRGRRLRRREPAVRVGRRPPTWSCRWCASAASRPAGPSRHRIRSPGASAGSLAARSTDPDAIADVFRSLSARPRDPDLDSTEPTLRRTLGRCVPTRRHRHPASGARARSGRRVRAGLVHSVHGRGADGRPQGRAVEPGGRVRHDWPAAPGLLRPVQPLGGPLGRPAA